VPPDSIPAKVIEAAPRLWSQAGQAYWVPVTGGSMLPFLRPGDEVQVNPLPARLRRGDLVLLRGQGGLVVHRVLWSRLQPGVAQVMTQGDHNRQPDAVTSADNLLGRVRALRRAGRTLAVDNRRWTAVGWLIASALLLLNHLSANTGHLAFVCRTLAGAGRRLLAVFRAVAHP